MTSRAKSSGDTPTPAAPYQIAQLPPKPSLAYTIIRGAIFLLFFLGTCVIINFAQVWSLPLLLLPNRSIYERYITYTRKSFGLLLVLITQFFGPSRVILTASPDCAKNLAKLDKDGQIEKLNLPRDLIMLSNHQVSSLLIYGDTSDRRSTLTGSMYGVWRTLPTSMEHFALFSRHPSNGSLSSAGECNSTTSFS